MGEHALLTTPSLWGLLPLGVYMLMIMRGSKAITATMVGIVTGFFLTGQTFQTFSGILTSAAGSFLGKIGLIIMLGSGLGYIMTKTNVTQTLVYWIVKKVKVDSEKKGILVTMISSVTICGLLGTLAGGNAIIAPVIIPVVAAVGLTPSTVGVIFQTCGEVGLILGPFTAPVLGLMAVTGLTYFEMLKWSALPFGILWLITVYIVALKVQKKTKSWDKYEDIEVGETFTPDASEKRTTIIFLVSFALLVGYGIITKQKTNYVPLVILTISILTGLASKMKLDDIFKEISTGMGKMTEMFLLFILLDPFIKLIMMAGGFEALSVWLMNFVGNASSLTVMMLGSLVGGFGIEGAAVAQIKITNDLFANLVSKVGLPMQMWAIALIAASRITSSVYPTANMVGQMGLARSKNLKAMLLGGWAASVVALIYIAFWAVLGQGLL